ncbi:MULTISPECIES: YbgF trimerization domain-containing protein [unclassified Acinetobacter]|uniref:YbgF trimerization domain-containing protein n=1 Tax=unclassified Acinetobacter TaxID=196816 RepID=UPI00236120D0|nr:MULTISPECIES: YbgF trimerization domain-containing protein [unclassified Acinetobacter]
MLKQHVFSLLALMGSASVYANIPIESRALSESNRSSPSYALAPQESPAGNLNWQLIQKNQQLENDIRSLRGKLEEQENEIEKLKSELTNRYTDLDQRLQLLQQKIEPETSTEEENQTPPQDTVTPSQPAAVPTSQVTTPSSAIASTPPSITAASKIAESSELEKAAYTVALDAYKQGGAKKAITPMQNFVKNHPNSVYTGNAYYWLAEFNLAIDPPNYAEAKKNYTIVSTKFSQSAKAPRALYQLYSIAKNVDRNNILASQYRTKLLATYPKSEEAGFVKK